MIKKYEKLYTFPDFQKFSKSKTNSAKFGINHRLKLDLSEINPVTNKNKTKESHKHRIKHSNTSKAVNIQLNNPNIKSKTPKYLNSDILTTYATTNKSIKTNNYITFKKFIPKLTFPTKEDNRIFKNTFNIENIKPIKLLNTDTDRERKDKFDDDHNEIQKLKDLIKSVLTGNSFNNNENILHGDNFFNKKENKVNFREDVMLVPHVKNKLYSNSQKNLTTSVGKKPTEKFNAENFLLSESVIKRSREEAEKLKIFPNFIDHQSNNYITKLKRLVQIEKDNPKTKLKSNDKDKKEVNNSKNSDVDMNREYKEYFSFNILKYRKIEIVDERVRATALSYNDKFEHFQNLK